AVRYPLSAQNEQRTANGEPRAANREPRVPRMNSLLSVSRHPASDIQDVGKTRAEQHAGREHRAISAFADCGDRGVLVEVVSPRGHVIDRNVDGPGDMAGVPFAFRAHVDERQLSTTFESLAKLSD